jgi:hypothetical protein
MIMELKTVGIVIVLSIPFFFATIWAVVDAAQKDFGTMGQKVLWTGVASIPFIGFFIYLLLGFRKGRKP